MSSVYSIELLRTQPLIVVDVKINGKGPFHFSVDTGASVTVVTPSAARIAKIKYGHAKAATAVSASSRAATYLSQLDTLEIGDLIVNEIDVAVIGLATVNRATHLNLGGLLGYNFLSRFRVTIDYDRAVLSLQTRDNSAS